MHKFTKKRFVGIIIRVDWHAHVFGKSNRVVNSLSP